MQRLIIHLKRVEPVIVMVKQKTKGVHKDLKPKFETVAKKKIFNTLNFIISSEKEIAHHLSMHDKNIKSYKTSFYK